MSRSRKLTANFTPKQPCRNRTYRPHLETLEDRTTPTFPATLDLGTLTAASGLTVNGSEDSGHAGATVAGIGDINGDGLADVAVAVPDAASGKGQVAVIFGKAGLPASLDVSALNGTNGFTITGKTNGSALGGGLAVGVGVASAGDVNGDGIDDFALVAPGAGQAYVIFGSKTGFTTASFDLNSLNGTNGITITDVTTVGTGGDVNGDGLSDVILGAPGALSGKGQAYVVFGSNQLAANVDVSTLNGTNGFAITGGQTTIDHLGTSVSAAGDVNGDGVGDVIVGAPGATTGNKGQAYVIFGSKSPLTTPVDVTKLDGTTGFTLTGLANNDNLGVSVSGAGDMNGDGLADVIIGAPNADVGSASPGQAYVVFGSKSGFSANLTPTSLTGANGFAITGAADSDGLGQAVSGGKDINHDGLADVIVGAPGAQANGKYAGQAYVIFGSKSPFAANVDVSTLNGNNGFTLNGVTNNDETGASVGMSGDVNGDGIDDVIVGAPYTTAISDPPFVDTNNRRGHAYVVYGRDANIPVATLTSAPNVTSTTADLTKYTFQVTYNDDKQINFSTLDNNDVQVVAPDGTVIPAQFVSAVPSGNTAIVATYSIAAPGGKFTTTNGGNYTIRVVANQVSDQEGNFVPAGNLGTFNVNVTPLDTTAPTATLSSAPNVNSATTDLTKYTFQVTYTDNGQVKVSTLDNSDVQVVAPNGTVIAAQFVSAVPNTDAGTIVATYSIAAPGGKFTTANGGTYTIRMVASQVSDTAGNFVAAGNLGTFNVNVTAPDTTAPTATLTSAPDITKATTDLSKYTFQVTYKDDGSVKFSTLDNSDIVVIGPDGTTYTTLLISAVPNSDAGTIVATYQFNPLRNPSHFVPADRGTYTIRMAANQVSDRAGNFVAAGDLGTFKIAIAPAGQTTVGRFAVGSGSGGNSTVTVRDADNSVIATIDVFPGFTGGVRVAEADVNGDGIPDLIVGTGPGVATQVKVISGKDGSTLFTVSPFESSFTGGVYVAAGDINDDGLADVIVTPDQGGGPVVAIYDGAKIVAGQSGDAAQMIRFFGIDDPNFRGGARASSSDINNDGLADLVVAAGFGGGPRIALFNGQSLFSSGGPVKFIGDFFVFEQTLRNGVFIGSGDLDGDGFADVIAGGGPGGGPRVFALSGKDLLNGTQTQVANFFAGDTNNRGGIRVVAKDLDGDGKADLITGAGDNAGSQVTAYAGKNISANGTPGSTLFQFDAIPGFNNGVYVG